MWIKDILMLIKTTFTIDTLHNTVFTLKLVDRSTVITVAINTLNKINCYPQKLNNTHISI